MPPYVPISVSLRKEYLHALRAKLPRYGDRSKLFNRLVEMYLQGKVNVVLPSKTIVVAERRL